MHEARLDPTPDGLVPAGAGWWVANLRDIAWHTVEGTGTWCTVDPPGERSPLLGFGVHVLPPGHASGRYHAETDQEAFLVLEGECLLVVEGEERTLRRWDLFHCPPGTAHITIGAGPEGCVLVMTGTPTQGGTVYPVEPLAAAHGASVAVETTSADEAYAGVPPATRCPAPWPPAA